jgi:hypothetical protein
VIFSHDRQVNFSRTVWITLHLSPATRDRAIAADWFRRFEGAGLDGVMAKRLDAPYRAGERTMIKVKHERTADCLVAGFRWHKKGAGTMIGSPRRLMPNAKKPRAVRLSRPQLPTINCSAPDALIDPQVVRNITKIMGIAAALSRACARIL